jgi:hypothetical protein
MQHVLLFVHTIIVASKDPKMSKQGTADKRKHVTLTIPQKPEIIRKLESGKKNEETLQLHTTQYCQQSIM